MENFSERIKKFRIESRFTQEQLAQKLFVTKQAVSKWETGKGYPDAATLPIISNILGTSIDLLMGMEGTTKKKMNIKVVIFSLISVLIIAALSIVSITSIMNKAQNAQEIELIESRINFEIPKYGTVVSFDFESWEYYGNSISLSQMSYIVFGESNDLRIFEEDIYDNATWMVGVPDNLLLLIPQGIQSYLETSDYYRLYNVSLGVYNEIPANQEAYDYVFLIYQKDNQRLIIFEYTLEYQGGVYEE
jgi:transcriptional regulator with XRE-family HTH domain